MPDEFFKLDLSDPGVGDVNYCGLNTGGADMQIKMSSSGHHFFTNVFNFQKTLIGATDPWENCWTCCTKQVR